MISKSNTFNRCLCKLILSANDKSKLIYFQSTTNTLIYNVNWLHTSTSVTFICEVIFILAYKLKYCLEQSVKLPQQLTWLISIFQWFWKYLRSLSIFNMQFSWMPFDQELAMINTIRHIDVDPVAQRFVKFNLRFKSH